MRIFKVKAFERFARKERITDSALCATIRLVRRGLIDADLGGGVIKQRMARPGEGKSGSYRTIILLRTGAHAFFVYGFAKSDQGNVSPKELRAFKMLAKAMLAFSAEEIDIGLRDGELIEVHCDE